MNAGDVWKKFGSELRPRLEADTRLARLAEEVLAGLHERLQPLMPLLFQAITEFLRCFSVEKPGFWYDDSELARRYSPAQTAVVPVRKDIAERMSDLAWASIERALRSRSKAYILDLGTGDGIMARTFLERRPKDISREQVVLLASDRSASMLKLHAERFVEYGIRLMEPILGDLRRNEWHNLNQYRDALTLDANFAGFDVITGMMCFHILPQRGSSLYPGIAQILRADGTLLLVHDFFRPGDSWSSYAPSQTLIDGYQAYALSVPRPINFVGYLAGFLLRRGILQDDQMCTLSEELAAIHHTFPYAYSEQHTRYQEFAVLAASSEPLKDYEPHPFFIS